MKKYSNAHRVATRLTAAGLLLSTAMTQPAAARVFRTWGAAADSRRAMETAGGKMVYEADVTVNGGDGTIRLFSFPGLLSEVLPRLESVFGRAFSVRGYTLAVGTSAAHGRVIRFVALRVNSRTDSLVFTLDQDADAYRASSAPPAEHYLQAVPPYPGSQSAFYAANHDTLLEMAVDSTPAAPSDVQQFYATRLGSDGWVLMTPASASSGTPHSAMSIHQKGPRLCIVDATVTADGQTRITVLHKTHEVK